MVRGIPAVFLPVPFHSGCRWAVCGQTGSISRRVLGGAAVPMEP